MSKWTVPRLLHPIISLKVQNEYDIKSYEYCIKKYYVRQMNTKNFSPNKYVFTRSLLSKLFFWINFFQVNL